MIDLVPLVGLSLDGARVTERELRAGSVGEPVWGPRGLLADRGVTPRLHPDVEAECVGHAGEDGGMLFIINRLGAQSGDIRIVDPDAYGYTGRLEVAYTFAGSHARAVDRHAIHVDLAAEDVLVLRLR